MKAHLLIAFVLVCVGAEKLSNDLFKSNETAAKTSLSTRSDTTSSTRIKSAQTAIETKYLAEVENEVVNNAEPKTAPPITPLVDSSLVKSGVPDNGIIASVADDAGYPEPTLDNADLPAIGLSADQVNLGGENKPCESNCADSANILEPAQGDYAEQINSSSLLLQAQAEGLVDAEMGTALNEVQTDSHPPVEIGAYIIPD